MKPFVKYLIAIALLSAGVALADVTVDTNHATVAKQLSSMTPAEKKQDQAYFTAHSFEFSSIFKSHHPGPYWILEKIKEFQLSSAQIKQQEQLKSGMAKSTIAGNAALKRAYEKYAVDAAATMPLLALINRDIDAIGKAQTHLAQVMVPYHLKAYAALNPDQQAIYRQLVAQSNPVPEPAVGGSTLEQRFARLDANNDGYITWEEALPSRTSDFDKMDKNQDKRITPDEFGGVLPFASFDKNKDGAISKAEFLDVHHRMFMKFDADGDKRISPSEFATAQHAAGK